MESFSQVIGFIETRFGSLFSFRKKDRSDYFFVIGLFIVLTTAYHIYEYYTYYWDPDFIDWAYLIFTILFDVILFTFVLFLWQDKKLGVEFFSFLFAYWLMLELILCYQLFVIYGITDSYPHYYEGEYHDVSYFNWSVLREYVYHLKFQFLKTLFYLVCLRYFLKLQNRNELGLKESGILLLIICGGGLAILFSSADIITSLIS